MLQSKFYKRSKVLNGVPVRSISLIPIPVTKHPCHLGARGVDGEGILIYAVISANIAAAYTRNWELPRVPCISTIRASRRQDVWLRKLRCSCGSTFRKNKWRTNQRGDTVYGYQCYNQVNNGSKGFQEKNGLDTDGYCDIRMVGDWKLDLMAKKIFEAIWTDRKEDAKLAYKLLRECYQADASRNKATIAAVQGKISRATGRMENLIAMRADGEISKEQFQTLRQKAETELAALNEELDRLNSAFDDETDALDVAAIEAALDSMLDFSGPSIDSNIIEKFVCRITPVDNGHYRWDLNFAPNKKQAIIGAIEGRK